MTEIDLKIDDLDSEADNPIAWFSVFALSKGIQIIHNDRPDENQLVMDLTAESKTMSLRCELQWDEEYETLYLSGIDQNMLKSMESPTIYQVLNRINRNTAVGYFTMNEEGQIVWRYSILFSGTSHLYESFFEDVLQSIVGEFERFQPIFTLASDNKIIANDLFEHAIQTPVGEA